MKKGYSMIPVVALGLVAAGAALGKESTAIPGAIEQVTVQAPRHITPEFLPLNGGEQVSLGAYVHYDDLDLRRDADANKLRERVVLAANEVCGKLASMYRHGDPKEQVCATRAIDKAMVNVRSAVAEARSAG